MRRLPGYKRILGVAMDNRVDLPGYKYYRRPDGSRPAVRVAFTDLVANPGGPPVNGVCRRVGPIELASLDGRERNYDRREVTHLLEEPLGRTWAYLGSTAGRARFAEGVRSGEVVVARGYLSSVESGFRALGSGEFAAFLESSDFGGAPAEELERVNLP